MKRIAALVVLGFVLVLALAGCVGGVVDGGPVQTGDRRTDAVDPQTEPGKTGDPSAGTPGSSNGTAGEDATTAIRLYFVAPGGGTPGRADPFLISVHREIPSDRKSVV